jgi:hypothetical protein
MSGIIYLTNEKNNLYGDIDGYFKKQSDWLKIVNHPGNVNYNLGTRSEYSYSNSNWTTSGLMPIPHEYASLEIASRKKV